MKQIIWILRQTRCGGTWFALNLAAQLSRSFYMFESLPEYPVDSFGLKPSVLELSKKAFFMNRKQEQEDYNRVLNTHDFQAVHGLQNYDNPLVLRIIRKNKTEQFLSEYLARSTNQYNVYNKEDLIQVQKQFTVPQQALYKFINRIQRLDFLWNSITTKYQTETIYYEDLIAGYVSPNIPNVFFNMQDQNTENLPLKLPYDKKEIFVNYNAIENYLHNKLG